MEAAHLADEVQARPVVSPVAVIEVAGDDQERNLLFDGESDQLMQSSPGGGANGVGRGTFMFGKPLQWTVQMNVCGVNEAKWIHEGNTLSVQVPLRQGPVGRHPVDGVPLSDPGSLLSDLEMMGAAASLPSTKGG